MNYVKIKRADNRRNTEHDLFKTVEDMLHHAQPTFALSRQRWRPPMDIFETDREIVVVTEIAGIQGAGIDLEIAPRSIKISGKRSLMFINREIDPLAAIGRYCLAEIPSGYFERTVSLPAPIDTATAETDYNDGLLTIRLVKSIPRNNGKITIKPRSA